MRADIAEVSDPMIRPELVMQCGILSTNRTPQASTGKVCSDSVSDMANCDVIFCMVPTSNEV